MQAIEFALAVGARARGRRRRARGRRTPAGAQAPAAPRYRCMLTDYTCTRLQPPAAPAEAGAAAEQRPGRRARRDQQVRRGSGAADDASLAGRQVEPTSRTSTYASGQWQRPVPAAARRQAGAGGAESGRQAGPAVAAEGGAMVSFDGSEGNAYSLGGGRAAAASGAGRGAGGGAAARQRQQHTAWSPDSQARGVPNPSRLQPARDVRQSSPSDRLQPKASAMTYRKPGDVRTSAARAIDVATKKQVIVDGAVPQSVQ
jgi:hypothetical protein